MLQRIPSGSTDYRFPDLSFGLDDQTFKAWWQTALLAEDASDYVHFHHGTLDGARFVCALKFLSGPGKRELSTDIVLQSYLIAKNLSVHQNDSVKYRHEAQLIYESDPVQWLLARVTYRSERLERERVALRTAEKLHELFDRVSPSESEEDALSKEKKGGMLRKNYTKKLATERAVLDAGLRFMSVGSKERSLEDNRRDRGAHRRAIEESEMRDKSAGKAPTSTEEAKLLMIMLRDAFGNEQFAKIVAEIEPPALTSGD